MTRRSFVQIPAGAPLLSQAPSARQSRGAPPDILFILLDQLTPFMIAPYGQRAARTPNLDRLARGGVVFENAYCNSPLYVPSRVSMLTERLPSAVESYDNASEFPAHWPTAMHYLRRAGYRPAVAGKCHFIGPDQWHGFQERLTPCIYPSGFDWVPDWRLGPVYNKGTSIQSTLRALGPSRWNRQMAFDQLVFDRSLERLRQHALSPRKQPLFLNISFTQPHDPFTSTQKFLDLYRQADIPLPKDHGDIRRLSPSYEWFIIHHGLDREKLSPDRIREARRNYLAMISWVDEKVGFLLDELERLELQRNTLVVLTSDHGEMLGEHGQWSKRILLEWAARVPLILSWPGSLPAGRRVSAPVSLLDLFPTLAEIASAQVETRLDGHSLLPLLDGRDDGRQREVVSEYLGEGAVAPMRMVRRGDLKYLTVHGHAPQLYDLAKDPEETVNLAGTRDYAAVERPLRARAEDGFNGEEMLRRVLASQQERLILRSMRQHGGAPRWEFDAVIPGNFTGYSG